MGENVGVDLEEFYRNLPAFIELVSDRLDDPSQIQEFEHVGEETLAVDLLAATLVHEETPITAQERDILRELLYFYQLPIREEYISRREEVLASLNVIDDKNYQKKEFVPSHPVRQIRRQKSHIKNTSLWATAQQFPRQP